MNTLFYLTLGFWFLAAIAVVWFVARFRLHVERTTTVDAPRGFTAGHWPEALVVMSLRGGDESLRATLDGLAAQNYPNYRLKLVVDNRDDEVNQVVRAWRRSRPGAQISVEYLREPLPSCTLKCSAVHQVLREVGPEVGVVVLVDGDADPYPNWLRDAVAPFCRAEVGGVTGNRWYFPREGGLAAWCRFVFTGFSLPAMSRESYSWGGTLALRRDVACSDAFLSALASTPTEEQTCFETLPKFGLKMHFAPQLIQWNPESATFAGSEQHLFRQLAWSRLFYRCWTPILLGAASIWLALLASFVFAGFALVDDRPLLLAPLALAGMFAATLVSTLLRLHRTLQGYVFAAQGREVPSITTSRLAELLAAIPCTLGVYSLALWRAHFADEIHWRGIVYRIFSDDTISMTKYVPWIGAAPARKPTPRPTATVLQRTERQPIGP